MSKNNIQHFSIFTTTCIVITNLKSFTYSAVAVLHVFDALRKNQPADTFLQTGYFWYIENFDNR